MGVEVAVKASSRESVASAAFLERGSLRETFPKGTAHIYSSLVFSVICSFYSIRFFQSEVLGAQRAEVTASSHTVLK